MTRRPAPSPGPTDARGDVMASLDPAEIRPSSLSRDRTVELLAFLAGADRWALVRGESLALLSHLPTACVDAVVTDGPYSSGGQFRGDRAQGTGSKYTGTAKPGAIGGFWCDWRQLAATIAAMQAGGWVFRGVWCWDKTEGVRPQKGRPRNQCEFVVWGSKGAMPDTRAGGVVEPGVVRCASTLASKRGHQTGKPDVANRLWARLCDAGGILLDPFAGSASMADACIEEGRRYLGFEVVPRIHEEALQRLRERGGAALGPRRGEQLTITGSGAAA